MIADAYNERLTEIGHSTHAETAEHVGEVTPDVRKRKCLYPEVVIRHPTPGRHPGNH